MALGKQNSGRQIGKQLKALYGRLAGELRWIENPPKLRQRPWRGGAAFAAEAPEREARAEHIRQALPHVAYVIQLVDPEWTPEAATLIRPSRSWGQRPPGGWVEAAYEVLRQADDFVTMREIVEQIAERHDIELSDGARYVQVYTAVSNGLMENYRDSLESNNATPRGWALKRRGLAAPGSTGGQNSEV